MLTTRKRAIVPRWHSMSLPCMDWPLRYVHRCVHGLFERMALFPRCLDAAPSWSVLLSASNCFCGTAIAISLNVAPIKDMGT
jgi:hypothetical protein